MESYAKVPGTIQTDTKNHTQTVPAEPLPESGNRLYNMKT